MKKKKLQLDQLKVASFITDNRSKIRGGAVDPTSSEVMKTRDPECTNMGSVVFCTENIDCAARHTFMNPIGGCKLTDLSPCPGTPGKLPV